MLRSMKELPLDRPLAFFDIESTGTNRKADRIIDLAVVRVMPAGDPQVDMFRFNPGVRIPAEATAIHGIRDADVADCPTFPQKLTEVSAAFENCDLAGFNILHFDVPLLCEEFLRAGKTFDLEGRRILDAQRIFHRREPRDLSAALKFYCGELHLDAHSALEDTLATLRVFQGQLARYPDLPRRIEELDAYCNPRNPEWVDRTGRLKWADGEAVINFGKLQGKRLRDLARDDTGFLNWMLKSDFPRDTQAIVEAALRGTFPTPPTANGEEE